LLRPCGCGVTVTGIPLSHPVLNRVTFFIHRPRGNGNMSSRLTTAADAAAAGRAARQPRPWGTARRPPPVAPSRLS
jgi:hypothetical protein